MEASVASPRPVVRAYKAGVERKETPSIIPVKKAEAEPEAPSDEPEEEVETFPEVSDMTTSFSQEMLDNAWKGFIAMKEAGGVSDSLKMIFRKPLVKKDETTAEIELSTDIERKFLKAEETALVQFLRKELNSQVVTLSIVVREAELKQRLYTDKEKFNYLAEKQPLLLKLKERLFLDTDF